MLTPVDRLYDDFIALMELLVAEPSLRSVADDNFRKALLLASASYFEFRLSRAVEDFAFQASGSSLLISSIVKRKAIDRMYHTWFDWEKANANRFYSMFGEQFADYMAQLHKSEEWLTRSVQAFMELGRSRNLLVHGNFGTFSLEKTTGEIYTLYVQALRFVESVPRFLSDCDSTRATTT